MFLKKKSVFFSVRVLRHGIVALNTTKIAMTFGVFLTYKDVVFPLEVSSSK